MLKETDLIEDHEYVSKTLRVIHGVLNRRKILKIHYEQSCITYCEFKGIKNGTGIMATMKTISIKSFLRWAAKDVTKKKKEQKNG